MKLQPDSNQAAHHISGHGPGFVEVNAVRYTHGVCVTPDAHPEAWGVHGFDALTEADFAPIAARGPAVVLIGTGSRQRFPAPVLLRPLMARGIGFEVMTTAAACRTYNILVGEGRAALALLLVDAEAATDVL